MKIYVCTLAKNMAVSFGLFQSILIKILNMWQIATELCVFCPCVFSVHLVIILWSEFLTDNIVKENTNKQICPCLSFSIKQNDWSSMTSVLFITSARGLQGEIRLAVKGWWCDDFMIKEWSQAAVVWNKLWIMTYLPDSLHQVTREREDVLEWRADTLCTGEI
jgi:hypothetical protein